MDLSVYFFTILNESVNKNGEIKPLKDWATEDFESVESISASLANCIRKKEVDFFTERVISKISSIKSDIFASKPEWTVSEVVVLVCNDDKKIHNMRRMDILNKPHAYFDPKSKKTMLYILTNQLIIDTMLDIRDS